MHPKASKVQAALDRLGIPGRPVELPAGTRTSAEAAAVGTTPARTAKSLVFLTADGQVVLVVASGVNRMDVGRLARQVGKSVRLADTVKRLTGFSIGGVPPVGHHVRPLTIVNQDLLQFETVWAGAGTPRQSSPLPPPTWSREPAAGRPKPG